MMSHSYSKNIACLESLWDGDVENKLTVTPLLQVISTINRIHFTHLTCNTLGELRFNLLSLPRKRSYRILYLAFHGNAGEIHLGDGTCVSMQELADMMGERFAGWIVHFGACGTLDVPRSSLSEFYRRTRVAMMIGYCKTVNWVESAAMDLILFDWLQGYISLGAMWNRVRSTYPDLVEHTGLTVHPE
ncbi:MAG: DUF6642 family protein [Bacteroidota bacterium]